MINQLNILIVDCDRAAAKTLANNLKRERQAIVKIVSSGEQAIEQVKAHPPGLIIMEIRLKGAMDGIATSKILQENYQIPLIYLTSYCDRATLKRSRTTHPQAYLCKPYTTEDLSAAIEDVITPTAPWQAKIANIRRKTKLATYKVRQIAHQDLHLPSLQERDLQRQRKQHRQNLPTISNEDAQIVSQLQQEGVYITSLAELQLPHTKRLIKELEVLYPQLYTLVPEQDWRKGVPAHRKFSHREILLWGLGERLLNIIENYIGLPLMFHGVDLRRDVADAPLTDARNWHLDIDDKRMIKIIIYLNNVGEQGGPFEYIPRSLSSKIIDRFHYKSGYITEEKLAQLVPAHQWRTCTAKAGSIIIADPCNIFHRAKPAHKNRYSITFGYTSQTPKIHLSQFKLSPLEWSKISPYLNERQITCLDPHKRSLTAS